MAHFYGMIQGHRGEASRTGTKNSGLATKVNGWSIGGKINIYYDDKYNTDIVSFYVTSGSNYKNINKLVASFMLKDGNFIPVDTKYPEILI